MEFWRSGDMSASCQAVHGTRETHRHSSPARPIQPSGLNFVYLILSFLQLNFESTRIWDVEDKRKQKTVIVIKSKERGARTRVNSCGYSQDGNMIGGGQSHSPVCFHFLTVSFVVSLLGWRVTYVANQLEFCSAKHDDRGRTHERD